MRLPSSSRRHAAHWHSYEGSAVVRAIQDAGWQTRDLELEGERVAFVRAEDDRLEGHPTERPGK
jgi:hypothetical protein